MTRAFAAYARGNRDRRKYLPYRAEETTSDTQRRIACLDAEFFAARAGQGCPRPDPIFIVGLPRSGSTLLEQILSSHSQVEGTMELPDIITIARRLAGKDRREDESRYPEILKRPIGAAIRRAGRGISGAHASTAHAARRSSSTRCRTISAISA